jgi:hypothetical protein
MFAAFVGSRKLAAICHYSIENPAYETRLARGY